MGTDLFRKSLVTAGVMVGAAAAFTGTITLVALLAVSAAVGGGGGGAHDGKPDLVPASKIEGQRPPAAGEAAPKGNPKGTHLPPGASRPT